MSSRESLSSAASPSKLLPPANSSRRRNTTGIGRYLNKGCYSQRVGTGAPVFMADVLEYLAAEESPCLLLRASWFDPLVEEKELEKFVDYYYYDDDDLHEIEFYSGRFSSIRFGNHRWVDNEYVSAERQEARPIQDSGVGPSHQPKKKENHAEELVGRCAKRALKRESC